MTPDHVVVERTDGVATVTIDRPESLNSLSVALLDELADAVEALMHEDQVSVVVVTGAGEDAFVSGAELDMFHGRSGVWFKREFRRAFGRVERAIEGGPKPVVAAVNGDAFGGGLELAVTCDLIYAAERARFGFPEITLGGMPGAGGTQRVIRLVGDLRAKELVMTGRPVPAAEAVEMGLATDVFPDDAFDDEVADVAATLAERAPVALWFAKEVINESRPSFDTGLALEAALGALLFETDDLHEGFGAFLDKREPEFDDWTDL
ncbi:enoyl-CoA hydratase/isomerase family protein [Halorubellus salinus]|uniref:enoyl-CoA hydratase/isomerase family protein n=1 Tax=Halorubellus salinus TaxID=755309 RepID=UPI001D083C48|nr:enoyl-CoA hydratase-related protein [Halorubellus salinus]